MGSGDHDKLRNAPLACVDLSTQLFDGPTSNDCHSLGLSSTPPHPNEVFTRHNFEDTEMEDLTPHMYIPASTSTVPPPTSTSSASEKSSGQTKKGRGGGTKWSQGHHT
uniref:Uncharacterized protein n=1 Tax=Lactuca sativa TaxID=4236 RepID=A0A9R1X1Z1_LACSA|nr:hypothetical protein LSAT_V11C800452670 [Lactuca sativa]